MPRPGEAPGMRLLLLLALAVLPRAAEAGRTAEAGEGGIVSPIQKVIELVQELREKIIADGKAEELIYNRMACWCETTAKSKAQEVKDTQELLSSTSADMNTNKGEIAALASDIHDLMTDIKENEVKQYKETTKRERQNADYMQNKAELTNAMTALDKAVQMLEGIDRLALLQGKAKLSTSQMAAVRAVKPAVLKAVARLPTTAKIPVAKLSVLEKLGQKFHSTYTPFEPTITQIMKDLLESFRSTAATETDNEASLQTSYEEIMENKATELQTKKGMLADKEEMKAKETKDLAANQALWETTAKQLKAANEVFQMAKEACTKKAEEWDERKKLRVEELGGVEEALDILTSDENRALIGKAARDGPGLAKGRGGSDIDFMQLDSEYQSWGAAAEPIRRAYVALRKTAQSSHNYKVAAIAAKILQHHKSREPEQPEWKEKVIQSIQDIVADLKDDQVKDSTTLDNCKEEIHQLQLIIDNQTHTVKRYDWKLEALDQKVEDIQAKIDKAAQQVEDILEMQAKLLSERTAENEEYNSEKTDDEGAIAVLESAIAAMSKFYEKQGVKLGKLDEMDGKFLQVSNDEDDDIFLQEGVATKKQLRGHRVTQPVFEKTDKDVIGEMNSHSFSDKGSRGQQSKGIISLMTVIKEDLESDIVKATKMENEAEAEYQDIKKQTDDEKQDLKDKIDDLKDDKSSTEETISDNEQFRSEEQERLENSEQDMSTLMGAGDEGKDISFPCEFMLKKYTERRHRREAEADGLREAIYMLMKTPDE